MNDKRKTGSTPIVPDRPDLLTWEELAGIIKFCEQAFPKMFDVRVVASEPSAQYVTGVLRKAMDTVNHGVLGEFGRALEQAHSGRQEDKSPESYHRFRLDDMHDAKDLLNGAIKQVDAYLEHGQFTDARRQFYGRLIKICGNYLAARFMGIGDNK